MHEIQSCARTRWLLMILSLTDLTLAKIANLKMSDFSNLKDDDPLKEELKMYRSAMQLSQEVTVDDQSPAIIKFVKQDEPMSRAGLHLIIKPVLDVI